MTNTNTTEPKPSSKPDLIAYHVREREDQKKGFWTRIGAAWSHRDGKGFNLQFDVVPLGGAVTLRVFEEKQD